MRTVYFDELSVGFWVCYSGEPCCFVVRLGGVYLRFLDGRELPYVDIDVSLLSGWLIDDVVLRRFGFVPAKGENVWLLCVGDVRLTVSLRLRGGRFQCRRCALGGCVTGTWNEDIRFVHELQRWWVDKVLVHRGLSLDLEAL